MGMYTEVFFRAQLRKDVPTELLDWFDELIDPDADYRPFDDHEFFKCEGWEWIFCSGGAVYQVSRPVQFSRRHPDNFDELPALIVHASLKNYGGEVAAFVDWITPFVQASPGDFLGYSLYEDTKNDYDDQESPLLIFMPDRKAAL